MQCGMPWQSRGTKPLLDLIIIFVDIMTIWMSGLWLILYLHCEPDNPKDSLAVAIVTGEDIIVDHTPESFNRQLFYFPKGWP